MTNKTDVLIIGGGVIGVCAAYFLAKQGHTVAVIERNSICSGSSYGNAGLIAVDHAIPTAAPGALSLGVRYLLDPDSPFYIKPRLDPELALWLWRFRDACRWEPMRRAIPTLLALARSSLALYERLHDQHALDDGYCNNGRMMLYRTQAGVEHAIAELRLLNEFGVKAEICDKERVQQLAPVVHSSIAGGVYYPGYAHLVPGRFVLEMASVAQSMGTQIHTDTELLGFRKSGQKISEVLTTRGTFQADAIVLAAGAWSAHIARRLNLQLPIQAAKGYSITAQRPRDFPDLPLSLGEAKVAVTPMGCYLRLSSTLEMSGLDMSVNLRRVSASYAALSKYLDGTESLADMVLWRGLRPMTPDSLPIIGRSGTCRNLTIATGHGMLGLTHGPITGKLVTQIINEVPPDIDLTPFRPDRYT